MLSIHRFVIILLGISFLILTFLGTKEDMEIKSEKQAFCKVKDEEKFKCEICAITLEAENKLANHLANIHTKCHICDKVFAAQENLRKHKKELRT